jgi:hypothetical protein
MQGDLIHYADEVKRRRTFNNYLIEYNGTGNVAEFQTIHFPNPGSINPCHFFYTFTNALP